MLPEPIVGVTTLPIMADLVGRLPVHRWVYYCVDDFTEWPGLDQKPLREMERDLVQRVDMVIAVSETLKEKISKMGAESKLLTHGIDLEHWQRNGHAATIPQLDQLERPLVVFWGVIDRRMDVEFVRQLAADLTQGTILLIGPESDPDPALYSIPRVVRLPALPYEQLPCVASHASVLIMPYADLPVTRAIQPLKLKEYLATGNSVVGRDLPSVRQWADCFDLVSTPEAFARSVCLRLQEGSTEGQRSARRRLESETWAIKAELFERWIFEEKTSLECSLNIG